MRRFSSYGPIHTKLDYYAPREALLANAYTQLVGEHPEEGGHYTTVWAPRQTGKTWVMQQVLFRLLDDERFDVVKLNLQHLQEETDVAFIVGDIGKKLLDALQKPQKETPTLQAFEEIFTRKTLAKPFILILDEFDALSEEGIAGIARIFRNIYLHRRDDPHPSAENPYHFLQGFGGRVYPEFPTGNGKIDLIITYAGKTYGLEVKSYTTHKEYQEALRQAAQYGKQLHLGEIALIVFVESIDETNRQKYEVLYVDEETGVTVSPVFVETGN